MIAFYAVITHHYDHDKIKKKNTKHKIDRNPSIAKCRLHLLNSLECSAAKLLDETLDYWLLVTSPQFDQEICGSYNFSDVPCFNLHYCKYSQTSIMRSPSGNSQVTDCSIEVWLFKKRWSKFSRLMTKKKKKLNKSKPTVYIYCS